MSLSIGIVGLPNVGKSTLFNALTRTCVPAENYPFCTIDPSVGVVPVPDERLKQLAQLSDSAKTIPAVVEFVDIAGLVEGAAKGEGLGNKFLAHIREVDAIAHVVRVFENSDITHVSGTVDPLHDSEVITLELILADADTMRKHIPKVEKESRGGDAQASKELTVLNKLLPALEEGKSALSVLTDENEQEVIKHLHLLSLKPVLFVLNKDSSTDLSDKKFSQLFASLEKENHQWIAVNAGVEDEVKELEGDEQHAFRNELGEKNSGVEELIQKAYELLGLITFFTTGEKETRGWTIARGSTAPQAGAAIHSDFRDKFIRADVIHCGELVKAGSYAQARAEGKVRTEGKEYVVQDGDVIEFRI